MSARVALLVTALALACAGCEGPCTESAADYAHSCDRRARVLVVERGYTGVAVCACPGSPLLDGGR